MHVMCCEAARSQRPVCAPLLVLQAAESAHPVHGEQACDSRKVQERLVDLGLSIDEEALDRVCVQPKDRAVDAAMRRLPKPGIAPSFTRRASRTSTRTRRQARSRSRSKSKGTAMKNKTKKRR